MRNRHKGKEEEIHHQNENNKLLMEWTSKQGRILTANGKAASYYTAARGFPYIDADLPHHHLMNNSTTDTFLAWAKEREVRLRSQSQSQSQSLRVPHSHSHSHSQGEHQHPDVKTHYPICGAFNRPLFVGGWEHSTDQEEDVYNVQTNTLFIDIRIPKLGRGRSMMKHGNNNNASTSASASASAIANASVILCPPEQRDVVEVTECEAVVSASRPNLFDVAATKNDLILFDVEKDATKKLDPTEKDFDFFSNYGL
eukprot:454068_1